MLTLLLALATPAHADELAYRACCAEAGADVCPEQVQLVGPGSVREGDGVTGLWMLTCDAGASFFPHARRPGVPLDPGLVVGRLDPRAAACFDAACATPADVCLEIAVDGVVHALQCGTELAVEARELAAAPGEHVAVVAAPGVVVRAERLTADEALARLDGPALPEVNAVMQTRRVPVAATPPEAPPTPVAAVVHDLGVEAVDWTLPAAPPSSCVANAATRQASNDQVGLGDEALVTGQIGRALGHYRAALQVNPCNPYAWSSLGHALKDNGLASDAGVALGHALALDAHNLAGWMQLGEVQELLGHKAEAIAAYQEAMALRPGYQPAEEGWRRALRMP